MNVSAQEDDKTRAEYQLRFGVRKLETAPGGVILLNGHRLNVHGASIHEDDIREGGALSARAHARGWWAGCATSAPRSRARTTPSTPP